MKGARAEQLRYHTGPGGGNRRMGDEEERGGGLRERRGAGANDCRKCAPGTPLRGEFW